jgi:EAL domain-containing protein (putative c-di-GMP-specific phosphodiesterase class I)
VHSEAAADASERAIQLLADLETALADRQIWLAYQPKWAIDEQRLLGAEALVRWRHPLLGPIAPDEFIPLLEKEGRLSQLTEMVLDQAIADMKAWALNGHDLGVAINISAPLLCDDRFVQMMLAKVQDANLPTQRLTMEVTESAAITDSEQVIKALEAIQNAGMRVSIDDYGTGQSTLTYLKSFPATEIKIDKSFVSRMVESPGDQVLVRSTIAMAHDLGFKVVAEGVEDGACLAKLVEFGCDVAQGWHIGKPVPEADFIALVEKSLVSAKQAA